MRHAVTTLRRLAGAPLFTIVAVATLAIGIGANTAMFSVISGVVLRPLPFPDPERLVGVWHTAPGFGADIANQSPATYLTYRESGRVFEDIGLWDNGSAAVTGLAEPERVQILTVTDGTLPILGVEPALGRRFTKADDAPGSAETVMISHGYWQRRFGGRRDVLDRALTVDGRPMQIVGVLPAGFRFLRYDPELILPMRLNRAEVFVGNFSYQGVARLRPGVTLASANADVARLLPTVPERFPLPPGFTRAMYDQVRLGPKVRPLEEDLVGDVDHLLWVLLGTVGVVLLIACANVANLFLVRAEGRQRELAIRAALGAGSRQLAAEILAESVALGLAAGVAGAGLAFGAVRLLKALGPATLPRLDEVAIDPAVLAFTAAISVLSGLLFGLIPVLRYARPAIVPSLVDGSRSVSDGRERHAARDALVVFQVALALVLLAASGLMIRTFIALGRVEPGFTRPGEVLTIRLSIPDALVREPADVARLHERIADRLRAVPGVATVGLSSSVTMDGFDSNDPIFLEDFPPQADAMPPLRRYKWVAPGFFGAIGNRIVAGRDFTWDDVRGGRPVVLVSQGLARQFWASPADAVGRRVRQTPRSPWKEIVGVVGDERDDGLSQPAPTIVYWPMLVKDFWTSPFFAPRTMSYAIRSGRVGSPTFLREVQQAVWSVEPSLPLSNVRTLDEILEASRAQTSFALVMLGLAGAVSLVLGLVGIYGVIAYVVSQRTREIGIRVALGAEPRLITARFLRHGLALIATGVGAGLAIAAVLTRLLSSMLFGVGALDPLTFGTTAALLGAVALLASYVPARRATRVDPVVALRAD